VKATWIAILGLGAVASAADAQPSPDASDRCQQGLAYAAKSDLPRASLYLEGCDKLELAAEIADNVARTKASVAAKLDKSKLSAMTIVTTPEGMLAETDALPGERFTTPATIWTKAGDYKVNVATDAAALDGGQGLTAMATLDPFSRRTVIINVPQKKQTEPKAGKVDFNDEPDEASATHEGPPPAQKFGSILPKKYRKPSGESSGPHLEDPLAISSSAMNWRVGARFGGGLLFQDASTAAASFSVAALAARPVAGPVSLAARLGWSHRKVDAATLEVGFGIRLAQTSALTLGAGAGVRGEVRVQDQHAMEEVARVGIGGAVELELALHAVPVALGLRFEPMFTELTPSVRAHGIMLELGYDWR
jgi:hypothetical protein